MKVEACSTRLNDSICSIYNDSTTYLTSVKKRLLIDIGEYIPFYTKFRGTLNKCREKVKPKLPQTQEKLRLSGDYLLTNEHNLFLRYDNLNMNQRMLIFMSNYGIEWAGESKMLFGDGTFKHTPDLSFQFYVNFTQKNDMVFPVAYTVLPSKSTEVFIEMLDNINDH